MKRSLLIGSFLLLSFFNQANSAQNQIPIDVYSTLYQLPSHSGFIRYQKDSRTQQSELEKVEIELLKPKIGDERYEDRLLVKFHFTGIETVLELALKWDGTKYILNPKENEADNHVLGVGVYYLQDRVTLFRYTKINDYFININSSKEGVLQSIDLKWKDDSGRGFSEWMGVDIDRVYEFQLKVDFKKVGYIVEGKGITAYSIPELRFYDSRPLLKTIPEDLKKKVKQDPQKHLPTLVQRLLAGQKDDGIKMVLLADWIADNIYYDRECFHDGQNWCDTDAYGTLKNGSTVCEGYAQLFKEMARIAGLPVISSGGYVYGGAVYGKVKLSRHAWNLVRLNGQWYLFDVTHNSQNSLSQGKYSYGGFDNSHSFMPMDKVGVKYYPDKALYQFIPEPQSFEQYQKNISANISICSIQDKFYDLGLSLEKPLPYEISVNSEPYRILLKGPSDLRLSLSYGGISGLKGSDSFYQYNPEVKAWELYIYPPVRKDYRIYVNAAQSKSDWNTVISLNISGQNTADLNEDQSSWFPKKYWDFNENQAYLSSPLQGQLDKSKKYDFRIYIPDTQKVRLYWNGTDSHIDFKQTSPGWFELKDLDIPHTAELRIYAVLPGINYYKALVSYQVK